MPAKISPWLRVSKGGLNNVTIVGQTLTLGGDGLQALADSSDSVTVTGRLRRLQPEFQPVSEEISAITSPRDNNMVVSDGFTVSIEILLVDDGINVDPLETLWNAYDVFKITWREGSATGGRKTKTLFATRGPRGADFSGKGQVVASVQFACVDPGAADFYTVATS